MLGENGDEADALPPHWGLVGGVGGRYRRNERRESVGGERLGNGFELRCGGSVGVPVGELVEARENPVLEVTCLRLLSGHFDCNMNSVRWRELTVEMRWRRRRDRRQHCGGRWWGWVLQNV